MSIVCILGLLLHVVVEANTDNVRTTLLLFPADTTAQMVETTSPVVYTTAPVSFDDIITTMFGLSGYGEASVIAISILVVIMFAAAVSGYTLRHKHLQKLQAAEVKKSLEMVQRQMEEEKNSEIET